MPTDNRSAASRREQAADMRKRADELEAEADALDADDTRHAEAEDAAAEQATIDEEVEISEHRRHWA